jgi:transcriptional regulator with XRE-family HTH domain
MRHRMKALGLNSWESLAVRCGLDRGTLWRYAKGEQVPGLARVQGLCVGLEVMPEELLRGLGYWR